jgi:hypothetical protein
LPRADTLAFCFPGIRRENRQGGVVSDFAIQDVSELAVQDEASSAKSGPNIRILYLIAPLSGMALRVLMLFVVIALVRAPPSALR